MNFFEHLPLIIKTIIYKNQLKKRYIFSKIPSKNLKISIQAKTLSNPYTISLTTVFP